MSFFTDMFGPACWDMNEDVYADEDYPYMFASADGGFSINAKCPEDDQIIVSECAPF